VLLTFIVPTLLVAGLAACGDDGDSTATTGDGGTGGAASDLVVQVTVGGGFVPVDAALSTVPTVTVLADGTVLTPGIVTMIYPGPAVSPIQEAHVDPADVDALVAKARELGLLDGPLDFGQPAISDAPTTSVTIVADGVRHTHDAYALSMGDGAGSAGVDATAAANRTALAELVAAAQALGVGDAEWEPDAYAVTVIGPATPDPSQPARPAVDWPLATAPATTGDYACTVVDGADAATLGAALASADQATPWVIGGVEYDLAFRPLVPGDPGCP
jgi:hypothetical protein